MDPDTSCLSQSFVVEGPPNAQGLGGNPLWVDSHWDVLLNSGDDVVVLCTFLLPTLPPLLSQPSLSEKRSRVTQPAGAQWRTQKQSVGILGHAQASGRVADIVPVGRQGSLYNGYEAKTLFGAFDLLTL